MTSSTEDMNCWTSNSLIVYPWLQKNGDDMSNISDITDCDIKTVINPEIGSLTDNYGTYGVHPGILPINKTVPLHDGESHDVGQKIKDSAKNNADSADIEDIIGTEDLLNSANDEQKEVANSLIVALGESVRIRVKAQSDLCAECLQRRLSSTDQISKNASNEKVPRCLSTGQGACGHARTAVLFSGGLDSLVLAALADRFGAFSCLIAVVSVCFCMTSE